MKRPEMLLVAASLILLVAGLVRIARPDRAPLRPVSIEAVRLQIAAVDPSAVLTAETSWTPTEDVYILGWSPWMDAAASPAVRAEIVLFETTAKTAILLCQRTALGASSPGLPEGTGFRAARGRSLTFRVRVHNEGTAALPSTEAGALLYFVPVAGN